MYLYWPYGPQKKEVSYEKARNNKGIKLDVCTDVFNLTKPCGREKDHLKAGQRGQKGRGYGHNKGRDGAEKDSHPYGVSEAQRRLHRLAREREAQDGYDGARNG